MTYFVPNSQVYGWNVDGAFMSVSPSMTVTFSFNGVPISAASLALSNTTAASLATPGGATFGVDDYRKVKILPEVGGFGAGGSRTFDINRVTSKATDDYVFNSTWVLNHSGANAQVQANTSIGTTSSVGANPGETWSLLGTMRTNANSDLAGVNHVAAYFQTVRASVPGAKIGVNAMGAVAEVRSLSGLSSATDGVLRTLELDMFCAGADDFAGGVGREVVPVVLGKGKAGDASPTITSLIGVYPIMADGVTLVRGLNFNNSLLISHSALTTINAVQGASANMVWLGSGHRIALDTAGTRALSYDAASGKLFYSVSGVNKFSIDASGNVRAAGTITGGVTP